MIEMLRDRLRGWWLSLVTLVRPEAAWRRLDDEVRFHLKMEAERLRRAGTMIGEDTMQDLKYGLRMIAKNPVFSAVANVTLALGIGANTAIYTVVEAVLLEPLPGRRLLAAALRG